MSSLRSVRRALFLALMFMTFCLISFVTSFAQGQSLYVDFGSRFPGLPSSYEAAANTPGVWNDVIAAANTDNLLDINGATTSVSVDIGAASRGFSLTSAPLERLKLLGDYLFVAGGNYQATFNGLSDGIYDVYYYVPASTAVPTGDLLINGTSRPELSGGNFTLIEGVSWDVLRNVNVSGGSLFVRGTGTFGNRGLAGLQLVRVPEPTSFTTAAVALVMALPWRRFRGQGRKDAVQEQIEPI